MSHYHSDEIEREYQERREGFWKEVSLVRYKRLRRVLQMLGQANDPGSPMRSLKENVDCGWREFAALLERTCIDILHKGCSSLRL